MKSFINVMSRMDVVLFLLCVLVLTEFPIIDINVSREFFDASLKTFSHKDDILIDAIYAAITKLPFLLLALLPVLAVRSYFRFQKQDQRRWHCCFLLACLLLGPGLLVNTIIKDNSVGRARPVQVQEFAGEKTFTPAFAYSGQCQRNCSFVSGHAAMGFYFIALGWVLGSSRVFFAGFAVGALSGFVRIVQGGHFFSDVVFAFWAVYLVTLLLGKLFALQHPLTRQTQARAAGVSFART